MLSTDLDRLTVKDFMTQRVLSIDCKSTVSEALGKMKTEKIHELVVTRKGKLIGILSYDHLIKRMNLPLNTKVENILTLPPKLSPDHSIVSAAETLISAGLRAAPVTTEDNKVLGILSKTDMIKIIPRLDDISGESVGSVMSRSPVCVTENDNITKAKELMKGLDEQTIPVVDSSGELSGLIDIKDISSVMLFRPARQRRETESKRSKVNIEIKSVMRQPVSVPLGTQVGPAVDLMIRNNLSCIVVTANDKPAGILTLTDLMELIARKRDEESVYVQITGLGEDDPFLYESLYAIIEKSIKRIAKMSKPQMLSVHVSQYNPMGNVSKYSLRARMNTSKRMYYTQAIEWDLMKAADSLMRELEGMVRKDKEKFIDTKKKPHLKSKLAKFAE